MLKAMFVSEHFLFSSSGIILLTRAKSSSVLSFSGLRKEVSSEATRSR